MKVYVVFYIEGIMELFENFTTAYEYAVKVTPKDSIESKTKVLKKIDKNGFYSKNISPESYNENIIQIFRKNLNRQ